MTRFRNQSHPAVVFTHFASLRFGKNEFDFESRREDYEKRYRPVIEAYCESNTGMRRIGIVYIYLDEAVQKILKNIDGIVNTTDITIPAALGKAETSVMGFLQRLVRDVSRDMSHTFVPSFQFIGLQELLSVITELSDINPQLPQHLCSPEHTFTYDSPKFVEAVIRLARSETPHLADYPIIRMDEDTICNAQFIDEIVDTYLSQRETNPFFYFSGKYGNNHKETHYDDVLNDYAVRVACFADTSKPKGEQIDEDAYQRAKTFLADLSELGAKQLEAPSKHYSETMQELLSSGDRAPSQPERPTTQVISGAGLVMSSRAISVLPPFMNFTKLTTWVDDYLKRRLHEAIEDIYYRQIECVMKVKIKQDRYPDGVTEQDIDYDFKSYYERLLRGCILKSIIVDLNGKPTAYSKLIQDFVRDRRSHLPDETEKTELKKSIHIAAKQRLEEVLISWTSHEFKGTSVYKWAELVTASDSIKEKHIQTVIDDALNYIDLVKDWPVFVRTIRRLSYTGSSWLFEPVR